MTTILLIGAILVEIIAIATLAVVYRTLRDTWDKLTELEARLRKLERGRIER